MKSIRQRLNFGLVLGMSLVLGVGGVTVYLLVKAALLQRFDAKLRSDALAIITATKEEKKGKVQVNFSDKFLREYDSAVATSFYEIYRASSGERLRTSDSLEDRNMERRSGPYQKPVYWELVLPTGKPGRAIGFTFLPRGADNHSEDRLHILLASERTDLNRTLFTVQQVLVSIGGISLLVLVLLVQWILWRSLRPLQVLASQAEGMQLNQLKCRFTGSKIPAELEPIYQALNRLLDRVEESIQRERRFSSNLAHELRTPLAELRMSAEVALQCKTENTEATLEEVLEISKQMEQLVSQLLSISRAEAQDLNLKPEQVEVDKVVRSVLKVLEKQINQRHLDVSVRLPPGMSVVTDAALFSAIVKNLICNAVQYSPPEELVTISTRIQEGLSYFLISNKAPNISNSDLGQMFHRFWRKDEARSAGTDNLGLGLPLSRSFAEALGMNLQVERGNNSGEIVFSLGPLRLTEVQALHHSARPRHEPSTSDLPVVS